MTEPSDTDYDPEAHAGAVLTIDLDAVVANWRLVAGKLARGACAAVVKADGYGLGADKVAPALAAAGCRHFFVASLEEGVALRRVLPEAALYVLHGPMPGSDTVFAAHRLVPVLNDLGQIEAWQRLAATWPEPLPTVIHLDTGMSRLGLSPGEVDRLAAEPERLAGLSLAYVMSHLVSAEEQDNPLNRQQLGLFNDLRARLPAADASLANGSGVFLGPDFHFDLARPGAVLYGVAPVAGAPNPMRQVVRLQGRIIQVRDVDSPQTVGYGASHSFTGPTTVATVALGYADGYLRHLSNRGSCFVDGVRVPVIGRVSMDLITLDVTKAPADRLFPGALVEVLGDSYTVDDAAADADTIGYEILTSLGPRYHRRYVGG
ncbi:MAG: alanine racemase [Alphaproteobacteria bacterium]|nr:alanine racemase [Alphaproteobacteria bacterium]